MHTRFRLHVTAVAVAGFLLVGCSDDSTNATATPATETTVTVQSVAFVDGDVTVAPGKTVTWINNDAQAHPLRFADGRAFDLDGGERVTVAFTDAGTFAYRCAIHANMTATVTVTATGVANSTPMPERPRGGY